jgi:hypothetical protein
MASNAEEQIDVQKRLAGPLGKWREPGAAELCDLIGRMLNGGCADSLDLDRLKTGVYRLRIGGGPMRTVMLKRLTPAIAQTDRLVAERWLPALGLAHRSPRLLAGAAERDGRWVWHAYEDIGDETLDTWRDPSRLAAAVGLVAELHTRGANHPLMPEVRWRARDHGVHFFISNVRDAIASLEALATLRRDVPPAFWPARTRLLQRLYGLLEDAPRRVRLMEEAAGPDTLLHGDLWPKNVFVTLADEGVRARFIDWDHVGAGPFTYDLSTFLYRSSPEERPWILRWYREAVERAGWRLPEPGELNLLLHTAETARYVHCLLFVVMAILNDEADWAVHDLVNWDGWFAELRPLEN